MNVGFEGVYFISPRFGIGVLATYQRLAVDQPDVDLLAYLAGGYVGPFAELRLPLDDRAAVVVVGSAGGIRTTVINRNTGISENAAVRAFGVYWLAGGGLSFLLSPRVSFDTTLRYQRSSFTAPASLPGKATASGLIVGLGFSLYFR